MQNDSAGDSGMPQGGQQAVFSDRSRFRETGTDKGQLCPGNEWQRRLWLLPPPFL